MILQESEKACPCPISFVEGRRISIMLLKRSMTLHKKNIYFYIDIPSKKVLMYPGLKTNCLFKDGCKDLTVTFAYQHGEHGYIESFRKLSGSRKWKIRTCIDDMVTTLYDDRIMKYDDDLTRFDVEIRRDENPSFHAMRNYDYSRTLLPPLPVKNLIGDFRSVHGVLFRSFCVKEGETTDPSEMTHVVTSRRSEDMSFVGEHKGKIVITRKTEPSLFYILERIQHDIVLSEEKLNLQNSIGSLLLVCVWCSCFYSNRDENTCDTTVLEREEEILKALSDVEGEKDIVCGCDIFVDEKKRMILDSLFHEDEMIQFVKESVDGLKSQIETCSYVLSLDILVDIGSKCMSDMFDTSLKDIVCERLLLLKRIFHRVVRNKTSPIPFLCMLMTGNDCFQCFEMKHVTGHTLCKHCQMEGAGIVDILNKEAVCCEMCSECVCNNCSFGTFCNYCMIPVAKRVEMLTMQTEMKEMERDVSISSVCKKLFKKIKVENDELTLEQKTLESDLMSKCLEVEGLQESLQTMKKENDSKKKELNQLKQQHKKKDVWKEEERGVLHSLEVERGMVKDLKKEKEDMLSHQSLLQEEILNLKREVEESRFEIRMQDTWEEECKEMRRKVDSLQKREVDHQCHIDRLVKERDDGVKEVKRFVSEIDQLKKTKKDASQKKLKEKEKYESLIRKLECELSLAKDELKKVYDKNEVLKYSVEIDSDILEKDKKEKLCSLSVLRKELERIDQPDAELWRRRFEEMYFKYKSVTSRSMVGM